MTQQSINVGNLPNDGTGDPIRAAFQKVNNNFTEIYARLTTPPPHSYGRTTDREGMVAYDSDYIYYCFNDYVDDTTDIWKRVQYTSTKW